MNTQRILSVLRAAARWVAVKWPYGYLCDFQHETQGRIRLTKSLWVIVGDRKVDGSEDALPASFVSSRLLNRIQQEMNKKWYAPR